MRIEYNTATRGYLMVLEPDLFGAFVLTRYWYGLHNQRGGMKQQIFLTKGEALSEISRIEKRRLRHGYQEKHREALRSGNSLFPDAARAIGA